MLDVLFEDNHLIAINKKVSDIVVSDRTGDESLEEKVKHYIKEKYHKPGDVFLGTIHRIDRPVSGIVLFARTGKALIRLNEMLKKAEVQKTYWAIVKNKPPREEDTLVHYLTRNPQINKSFAYDEQVNDSKKSVLIYRLTGRSENYYFLEIELVTGRHHQIRAQLSAIGCPVKGDLKYGSDRSNPDGGIHLHSREMTLIHPVKKENISIVARPPDDKLWNEFLRLQQ
ncbi:MAG: RluA family pseudouridine synthase [Bacteroidia bacterium]|nr:RluA family pseudouridine synthase [Bacteroidia bacterium]